mgnify:CR=1 FL=1
MIDTVEEKKWRDLGYEDMCWGYPLLDHVWKKKTIFRWNPKYPMEYKEAYRKGNVDAYTRGHTKEKPWHYDGPDVHEVPVLNNDGKIIERTFQGSHITHLTRWEHKFPLYVVYSWNTHMDNGMIAYGMVPGPPIKFINIKLDKDE